jgi:predicted NBD/HSP70 family sugar kinase
LSLALGEALFFVGIDWAAAEHAVCVMDESGKIVSEFVIKHSADGIAQLVRRLVKYGDPERVPIAIVSRSKTRFRAVTWGFAAGSVPWLRPSRGAVIARLSLAEGPVRPAGGAGPV